MPDDIGKFKAPAGEGQKKPSMSLCVGFFPAGDDYTVCDHFGFNGECIFFNSVCNYRYEPVAT